MLKGTDLKVGMIVVIMKISKKVRENISENLIHWSQNKPLTITHIDYPLVVFEYRKDEFRPVGPFQSEKIGEKISTHVLDVRGIKFKQVDMDYVNAVKDKLENNSTEESWPMTPIAGTDLT